MTEHNWAAQAWKLLLQTGDLSHQLRLAPDFCFQPEKSKHTWKKIISSACLNIYSGETVFLWQNRPLVSFNCCFKYKISTIISINVDFLLMRFYGIHMRSISISQWVPNNYNLKIIVLKSLPHLPKHTILLHAICNGYTYYQFIVDLHTFQGCFTAAGGWSIIAPVAVKLPWRVLVNLADTKP